MLAPCRASPINVLTVQHSRQSNDDHLGAMQCPAPLLRLLSALSSSKEAAVEANAYLARLDTLALLHHRSGDLVFLVEGGDANEEAEATAPMSVLGVADAIPKVLISTCCERKDTCNMTGRLGHVAYRECGVQEQIMLM